MARTQTGKKQAGPRDPTKEARIQAATHDTLTGVYTSFRSAAIAHCSQAHLQDPNTRQALANNPQFSALYDLKRRGNFGRVSGVTTPTSTESLAPSASTSLPPATNNVSPPQVPFFSQMQGSLPIPYSNHWPRQNRIGTGFSSTAPVASTSSPAHLNNNGGLYYSSNPQYIF
ncbi:hypothetical protein F4604DRAFT_1699734 [Suillus subluteus]|nr:hypothetical protein F4604DRAFT_1699734 [Suillus subluteus]